MNSSVAIIAPGRMGSAIGRRLAEHGIEVRTNLAGRSPAAAARAEEAGMTSGDDNWLASSDLILSIVPPSQAVAVASRFAEVLTATSAIYVDLNAVNPETTAAVEAAITGSGARFVDGSIIGTAPRAGYGGPYLYLSGPHAVAAGSILGRSLKVAVLDGPNGSASALKMCFAAIMKGLTAVGCASFLAAARIGALDALKGELANSQPSLAIWFGQQIPAIYPKTYRWVAEMEEIAAFLKAEEGKAIFAGAARLFEHLSGDDDASARSRDVLKAHF